MSEAQGVVIENNHHVALIVNENTPVTIYPYCQVHSNMFDKGESRLSNHSRGYSSRLRCVTTSSSRCCHQASTTGRLDTPTMCTYLRSLRKRLQIPTYTNTACRTCPKCLFSCLMDRVPRCSRVIWLHRIQADKRSRLTIAPRYLRGLARKPGEFRRTYLLRL